MVYDAIVSKSLRQIIAIFVISQLPRKKMPANYLRGHMHLRLTDPELATESRSVCHRGSILLGDVMNINVLHKRLYVKYDT